MSTTATTPMISPDGDIGDVPQEHVNDAVKAGFQLGQDMVSPDGKNGTIPFGKVHDAIKAGFQMKPPAAANANVSMEKSSAGALAPQPVPSSKGAGAKQGDEGGYEGSLASGDQGKANAMSVAGAGAAAGIATGEAIPAVLPHTIEGVKAITKWAEAHPVHAYALFNIMKELVPGAKKTIGLVKGAPGE
jgi:hypothetical protein